jgi:hypothetical protein
VLVGDPLDDGQSDPSAGEVLLVVQPLERPEQLALERRAEPNAVVAD